MGSRISEKQTNNGVNLEKVYLRFVVGGELAQTVTQYQSFTRSSIRNFLN